MCYTVTLRGGGLFGKNRLFRRFLRNFSEMSHLMQNFLSCIISGAYFSFRTWRISVFFMSGRKTKFWTQRSRVGNDATKKALEQMWNQVKSPEQLQSSTFSTLHKIRKTTDTYSFAVSIKQHNCGVKVEKIPCTSNMQSKCYCSSISSLVKFKHFWGVKNYSTKCD